MINKNKNTIETERLLLYPLRAKELKLWAEKLPRLERELNCVYKAEPIEGGFLEIVRQQLKATESDEENYCWHSFWFLIRRSDRTVVGAADFKDVPDENGVAEIGYGLGKAFEHNGYMTEAVAAMCEWAFSRKDTLAVSAETELDGYASQRVLKRCGFCEISRGETAWWMLRRR